ncbi:recombinase family protein [Anaeromyxobacter oryzae]|uniref:recombinase family protein n=1 Tax=Anaeromyxobacter oryzae TaxID=2918170 RepID=UPI00384F43B0
MNGLLADGRTVLVAEDARASQVSVRLQRGAKLARHRHSSGPAALGVVTWPSHSLRWTWTLRLLKSRSGHSTSGPVRPLLVAIFGWVAEQERAQLIERVHAGLERARREGKVWAAPGPPSCSCGPPRSSWGTGRASPQPPRPRASAGPPCTDTCPKTPSRGSGKTSLLPRAPTRSPRRLRSTWF